jgi:hypothetical protein
MMNPYLLLLVLLASLSRADGAELVDRQLTGGYERLPEPSFAANDELQRVASWVVTQLPDATTAYTFVDQLDLATERSSLPSVRILRAFRQVVAGLNFRLVLALTDDTDACLGALAVTVYDHFGQLSVTLWGQEIDCDRAMATLTNEDFSEATSDHFGG